METKARPTTRESEASKYNPQSSVGGQSTDARWNSSSNFPTTGSTGAGINGTKIYFILQPAHEEVVTSGGSIRPTNEIGEESAIQPSLRKISEELHALRVRDPRPDAQKYIQDKWCRAVHHSESACHLRRGGRKHCNNRPTTNGQLLRN